MLRRQAGRQAIVLFLGVLGCSGSADEPLAVSRGALESPTGVSVDSGRGERDADEEVAPWLPRGSELVDSVVPAAHGELARRQSRARTGLERVEARRAVYAEASRALEAGTEPFEARYRAAVALRSEIMGSDEAVSEYLEATAEQQQAGTEARPTRGDLAWTLPAGMQAVVDETDRQSQRMEEAVRGRATRDVVLEENLAGYEAMMEAARRGPGAAHDEPRAPGCGLEVRHEE